MNNNNINKVFPIYNEDGTPFNDLILHKATYDSTVMSLSDKISGDVYYKDNTLTVTMREYILLDGVKFVLVNPPTIVREGMVSDNSDLRGMTKYSFEFYHPMYILSSIPFSDVAVSNDELVYKSQDRTFSWMGYLEDFVAKLNKNLQSTPWGVSLNKDNIPSDILSKKSDVLSFNNNTVADALKTAYDTWNVPFIVDDNAKLPKGYTLLDYIEGTGTQFIDTGVFPTRDMNFSLSVSFNVIKACYLFGADDRDSDNVVRRFCVYYSTSANKIVTGFQKQTRSHNYTIEANTRYDFVAIGNKFYINGTSFTNPARGAVPEETINIGRWKGQKGNILNGKIYGCTLSDANENLLHNYIPCINSDGEVGLFDTIAREFHGSSGQNDFIAGNVLENDEKEIVFGSPSNEITPRTNLWNVTIVNGYLKQDGERASSGDYNSCLLTLISGHKYKIKQTHYSTYNRVFTYSNDSYTQVYSEYWTRELYYICPNDGQTYVLQVAHYKNPTAGLSEPQIYDLDEEPFVFKFGQGVGLKNNSRNPRNNKIVTRVIGYGSADNIPYGYPQVRWWGTSGQSFTYGDRVGVFNNVTISGHTFEKLVSYPIYKGILGGQYVELIKHPFTRKNLMPAIYRETLFNKISFLNEDGSVNTNYNPDIELVDYYDAIGSDYPNNIIPQLPSSEIHEFSDIKPMLAVDGEYHIVNAVPINNDRTVASDWDDTMDDKGEYIQSYFKVKLPVLHFDIYACAAITQSMQLNMRSGACIGCTFDIEVDWEDYKKNFYQPNGDFDPVIHTSSSDGHVRDGNKYPNSKTGQIEVIVKKDIETFGTIMPNVFQHISSGDEFVILGISLPNEYITNAETRLSLEMKSWMKENNIYYFDYPLKFDEYFLATHTNILEQIQNNKVVRFLYVGEELQLYVKQVSIKYGESVLPKYDITLTDNIEVVLNKIGQAMEDIRHLNDDLLLVKKNTQTTINRFISSDRGKLGRFYYYAQEWIDTDLVSYTVSEVQAPYFSYNDEFWVFNPKENGTYTLSEMGTPHESSVNNPSDWVRMLDEFKYIMTDAIFGNYAHFGSAIINGDWMISQHGKINGIASVDYSKFQPQFIESTYICDRVISATTQYANVGTGLFVGGNTYKIQISFSDSSLTSSTTMNLVMWDGTQAIGNEITISNFNNVYTLTFTPTQDCTCTIRYIFSRSGGGVRISAYVDDVFIPNYAVDLLTGKSYENELNARGKITADFFYSTTKKLYGETSYSIDLSNEPYGFYLSQALSPYDCVITLPSSIEYEGLEIKFFSEYVARLGANTKLQTVNNESIMYNGTDNLIMPASIVTLTPNILVTLKAIDGMWFVIQGTVTVE